MRRHTFSTTISYEKPKPVAASDCRIIVKNKRIRNRKKGTNKKRRCPYFAYKSGTREQPKFDFEIIISHVYISRAILAHVIRGRSVHPGNQWIKYIRSAPSSRVFSNFSKIICIGLDDTIWYCISSHSLKT